jgi:ribosomal protein L7Ae-like RNA K-turn-binding protein
MIKPVELDNSTITLIGFALKAGNVVKGWHALVSALQKDSVSLIILNSQISENSQKKVMNVIKGKKIPVIKTASTVHWEKIWGIGAQKILGILKGDLGNKISNNFKAGV